MTVRLRGKLMKSLCLSLFLAIGILIPALAQDAAVAPPVGGGDYEDIKRLLDSIQARIDKMNKRSSEADAALRFLDEQVREAVGRLSSRQDENAALRDEAAELNNELGYLTNTREILEAELSRLGDEQARPVERLENEIAALSRQLAMEQQSRGVLRKNFDDANLRLDATVNERNAAQKLLEAAHLELKDSTEKLKSRQDELERVRLDMAALMEDRTKFEDLAAARTRELDDVQNNLARTRTQNARLSTDVTEERRRGAALAEELAKLRLQRQDLEAQLAARRDEIKIAQSELEERDTRLEQLTAKTDVAEQSLAEERAAALEAQKRVEELAGQLALLSGQLTVVNDQLAQTEATNTRQQTAIFELERQLNQALAAKVEELAKYRSEFFGKLREVLDQRDDIRVVGDRFVFQAEVLFNSGAARLEPAGRTRLKRLAETLVEIAPTIPKDVDWVLRIDGHTDVRPIMTDKFPSNWELSTARATSVVKFLIDAGISAHRLAAAGFGQHHPIDPRGDEIAYRRNRRIEFKLTQR